MPTDPHPDPLVEYVNHVYDVHNGNCQCGRYERPDAAGYVIVPKNEVVWKALLSDPSFVAGLEAGRADIEAGRVTPFRPKLTAERLAETAYADRPPTGPRPVPWPPVKRHEWQAWARRVLAALAAEASE